MIKEILQQELGLHKFSRRRVPHSLSDPQRINRATKVRVISAVLHDRTDNSFDGVVIGNKSWFVFIYLSDHMFTAGRNEVISREKQMIVAQNVMLAVFYKAASDRSESTTT
jgi:hypothetical protein